MENEIINNNEDALKRTTYLIKSHEAKQKASIVSSAITGVIALGTFVAAFMVANPALAILLSLASAVSLIGVCASVFSFYKEKASIRLEKHRFNSIKEEIELNNKKIEEHKEEKIATVSLNNKSKKIKTYINAKKQNEKLANNVVKSNIDNKLPTFADENAEVLKK